MDFALSIFLSIYSRWISSVIGISLPFFFFVRFHMIDLAYRLIRIFSLRIKQVQEKKVKKISDMNVDPKAMGNGSIASSSSSSSSRSFLANGVSPDGPYNYLSNDFSFPPGGIPSLRLPLVVVFSPSSVFIVYQYLFLGDKKLWYGLLRWTTQKLIN